MISSFLSDKIKYIFILLVCFSALQLRAQDVETVVVGQILNKADRTPIPSVNIYFKNSGISTQSNEEGYFMIRTRERHKTLIFSCIGYKQEEIHLRPGQSVGIEVGLQEINTELQEVFVVPGANPANEFMRKVRVLRHKNDLSCYPSFRAQTTDQDLVLVSKSNQMFLTRHIFEQLHKGSLHNVDSTLYTPLYMAETRHDIQGKARKEAARTIFNSPESIVKLLEKFTGNVSSDVNFYDNSVTLFDKSFVSPMSSIGNLYYDFFLADSLPNIDGKSYEIHFRSKNKKNLAFDGKMWIDSASLALTAIQVTLPPQANINFIHNLKISKVYGNNGSKLWAPRSLTTSMSMNFALLSDSLHKHQEVFFNHTTDYAYSDSVILPDTAHFANSEYTVETLDSKLKDLNNTPLLRTARWIADVVLTGYMQIGKIDVGKVQQLARVTDQEGFRLNVPLRTNERLWKDVSIGGYAGMGTKSKELKYSGFGDFRLPGKMKKTVGLSYTDDYRRIDYNYNNFLYLEDPLVTGDEDIASTLFCLWSADKLNRRRELQMTYFNDWNNDIESNLYLRSHQLFASQALPMHSMAGKNYTSFFVHSATVNTRFSFDERTYEDHLQRIYIANNRPVLYLMLEGGRYYLNKTTGNYGKINASLKQYLHFDLGELDYTMETGCILGKVPYPLLDIPMGTESGGYGMYGVTVPTESGSGGYGMYSYNMMDYMEFGFDHFFNIHSQLTTNGILLNKIPVIKMFNLRELVSFKMAYGGLRDDHRSLLQYPDFLRTANKPYIEAGVGLSNILHIFSVQSVWRLNNLDSKGISRWGIRVGLSIGF